MNRAYDVTDKYHLPKCPGDLCVVDLYGSLPILQGNDKYVFVCYDVFYKYVKLNTLKFSTTKACLNKLLNHYFFNIIKPKVILSDGLKLNGKHQLLAYADDVNILGGRVHTVKKNSEALVAATKETGLEIKLST